MDVTLPVCYIFRFLGYNSPSCYQLGPFSQKFGNKRVFSFDDFALFSDKQFTF
jgi:hypothetical protein